MLARVAPEAVTSPLFRIRGQKARWVYPDPRLTPEDCEVLLNVNRSERGIARSRYGYGLWYDSQLSGSEPVMGLWQGEFSSGATKQVVVTPDHLYSMTSDSLIDITGTLLSGGNDDRMQFCFVSDTLVTNNGVDIPRTWSGDDTTPDNTAALTGIDFTKCDVVLTHQNLLLAAGLTESGTYYPTRLRWCDINRSTFQVDITNWPSDNRYEVYDGGPPIVGAVDCWGTAMIFKQDGLYPGRIVYDELGRYAFRLSDPRRGFTPVSRWGIVARPEFVLCVAREGLVVIGPDMSFQIANTDDVSTWLDLNQERLQYAQAYVREKDHQIRILCSSATESSGFDKVLVWDWDDGSTWFDEPYHTLSYGLSLREDGREYDWLGTTGGYLFKGNASRWTDDNGNSIPWQIKTQPNDLGLPGKRKKLLNLRVMYWMRTGSQAVRSVAHLDEGRQRSVSSNLDFSATYQWNTGVEWSSGKVWSSAQTLYADVWVNRICETVALELTSASPVAIVGYQAEYIQLEG